MSEKKLSFLEIAKLNKDKDVKKEIIIENKEQEEEYSDEEEFDDINIKNADIEFDEKYNSKIADIKIDFLEFIRKNYIYRVFLNNQYNNRSKYNFFDYIKYSSNNYYDIIKKTNKENDAYIKILEEEEKKKEEINEFVDNDEHYYHYKY
jgi:hypothetical protein